MALKPDDFDFISNFDTAWAVVLGAVLATLGGVVATHMERLQGRRERERNAALLFGEILAMLELLLGIAGRSRGQGEPYGRVTMRILRSARREIDAYDRNRERLFDLTDGALRARIHTFIVRIAIPLDNIFDLTRELADAGRFAPANSEGERGPGRPDDTALSSLVDRRDGEFDYMLRTATHIPAIVGQLEPLAGQTFEGLIEIARSTGVTSAAQPRGE